MCHPYYIPLLKPNLDLHYEYNHPYQQYKTDPWYMLPTYDLNRVANRVISESVPSNYTYGKDTNEQNLNYAYSPIHDSVTHYYTRERSNSNATYI